MPENQGNSRSLVISADQGGIFISPKIWADLYLGSINKLGLNDCFVGTEMYPWIHPRLVESVMGEFKLLGVGLEGMHLRTGGIHEAYNWKDRVILAGLNVAMVKTTKSIELWNTDFQYMLMHSPEARQLDVKRIMSKYPETLFYIENHQHIGADGTCVAIAKIGKMSGLNLRVMLDLWHDLESFDHIDEPKRVDFLINNLEWVLSQAQQGHISGVGLHVSLGRTDNLSKSSWNTILTRVGKSINKPEFSQYVQHIVLENQPLHLDAISMPFWRVKQYSEENEEKLKLIKETGLLG